MLFLLVACLAPTSGNYVFAVTKETSDCPDSYEAAGAPSGSQTMTVDGDTVTLAGEPDEVCTLDDLAFDCPLSSADSIQDYSDQGLDAVYTIDANMSGEWVTSASIEGTMLIVTTCDGGDCKTLADAGAPSCTMRWDFTADR